MGLFVFDGLDMQPGGPPAAEIDGALARSAGGLHAARAAGDKYMVGQLKARFGFRLDQRYWVRRRPIADTACAGRHPRRLA